MDEYNEKVRALIQFLGLESDEKFDERIGLSEYNDNVFLVDSEKEFLICTDDEADYEYHESFMNLVDDLGIESFSESAQKYIIENFVNDTEWFDRCFEESTRSYAEDIALEDNNAIKFTCSNPDNSVKEVLITNRLLQECLETEMFSAKDLVIGESITEDGEWIEGNNDLVEKYCDYFSDATTLGYDDAIDWFIFEFGKEYFSKIVESENLIDWEAVCEWTKEQDGRGNELGRWDGKEYEEVVENTTYYIYANCDYEDLIKSEVINDNKEISERY